MPFGRKVVETVAQCDRERMKTLIENDETECVYKAVYRQTTKKTLRKIQKEVFLERPFSLQARPSELV